MLKITNIPDIVIHEHDQNENGRTYKLDWGRQRQMNIGVIFEVVWATFYFNALGANYFVLEKHNSMSTQKF